MQLADDDKTPLERYLGSTSYAGPAANGDVVISDDDEAEQWLVKIQGYSERLAVSRRQWATVRSALLSSEVI